MSDSSLSLRINSPQGVASTILNSMHPLKEDEALCYYWVIRPNVSQGPTNHSRRNFRIQSVKGEQRGWLITRLED